MASIRSPSGKEFQTRQFSCLQRCELQIWANGGGDLNQCVLACQKGEDLTNSNIRRGLE